VRACLDDGPVGVGVGEGQAELDDVSTAGVQEPQRLRRRGQVGVAGGDVRDERRLRSRTPHQSSLVIRSYTQAEATIYG